jgi:MOSC domain-containing protein YiiM
MHEHEPGPVEDCDECGFRWELWSPEQAASVVGVTGALLRGALEGVELELANTRPAADSWSILEYVDHIRDALWVWRFAADAAVGEPGIDLRTDEGPVMNSDVTRFDDVAAVIANAEVEGAQLSSTLRALDAEQWGAHCLVSDGVIDQRWIARHALHEVLHHLHDVARIRVGPGDGVPQQRGTVAQLNRSGGGVPKLPVDELEITRAGVAGDHQNDRVHHGRPFQAVCLYGLDVIEALQAEGHPIFPGAAGENITIAGIDGRSLRPGTVVSIGDEVRLQLSAYAIPCKKNAAWFADGDFRRMLHDLHPGWSRIYATVLQPGEVHTGDAVVVEP